MAPFPTTCRYHFAPRLRYTSNKIVGVVVGGLGWSTGMVTDTVNIDQFGKYRLFQ